MIDKKYIWAYGLKNAIEHSGKAVVGSVIAGLFNCGLEKKNIKNEMPGIQKILKEINSFGIDEQKNKFKDYEELIGHRFERDGLPELPNVGKKGVVTRFSPSPSGALTLGHILTIEFSLC